MSRIVLALLSAFLVTLPLEGCVSTDQQPGGFTGPYMGTSFGGGHGETGFGPTQ